MNRRVRNNAEQVITFYVPVATAAKPLGAACVTNEWWIVHPERGAAFCVNPYRQRIATPQCHHRHDMAEKLLMHHPGCKLERLQTVFLDHAETAMLNRKRSQQLEKTL